MAEWRCENPKVAEIHDDRLIKFRRDLFTMMRKIGVERKLPRSNSTVGECRAKGKGVFAGSRVIPACALQGTAGPVDIMNTSMTENVFKIGSEDSLIEGSAVKPVDGTAHRDLSLSPTSDDITAHQPEDRASPVGRKPNLSEPTLGRPKSMKELE